MALRNEHRMIRTYTGVYVDVFDPKPEMFAIEDIAHSLSMIPRFLGHTPGFYSVAQHSIHVGALVSMEVPDLELEGLLHDATEAYLSDIPSPIKHSPMFAEYRKLEKLVAAAIQEKFGLVKGDHPIVKKADRRAYVWEAEVRQSTTASIAVEQPWRHVEYQFLKRFYALTELREQKKAVAS